MTDRIQIKSPATYHPADGEVILAEGVSYEDYRVRFDGQHTEWVMGYVIEKDMTNNTPHNRLIHFLSFLFTSFMLYRGIEGEVLLAGITMFLGNDKPAREPDLMIVLGDKVAKITPQHLEGAADLCVEVVSPESIERDRVKKLKEFEAAGVAEYWLADPLKPELLVYALNAAGHYEPVKPDAEGKIASKILPGFVIDPTLLWRSQLPAGAELKALVQSMLL